MKFGKEESILKLDKCRALFQIHLLAAQDPWRRISTRIVSWSSWLLDLHVFHLPAKGRSKSQRCVKPGPWITALQWIRRMNTEQVFHIQHFVYKV